jgi:hypothetical protein
MHRNFLSENLHGKDHAEDLGVDGKNNIRMKPREIGWDDVDWIHLAQDREQWRTLVNTVMKFRVS